MPVSRKVAVAVAAAAALSAVTATGVALGSTNEPGGADTIAQYDPWTYLATETDICGTAGHAINQWSDAAISYAQVADFVAMDTAFAVVEDLADHAADAGCTVPS
jgi:hypothetical protein